MLDDETKVSLRNVVAAIIFIGGIVYGWQVTIGGINSRLAALEQSNSDKGAALERIEGKVDRLIDHELGKK